jgi:hypothetical protein
MKPSHRLLLPRSPPPQKKYLLLIALLIHPTATATRLLAAFSDNDRTANSNAVVLPAM